VQIPRVARDDKQATKPYADPYLAGVGLGLVLLAAFVVMGRGLGASGAFASVAAGTVAAADSSAAASNGYFSMYASSGQSPWTAWLLFELIGVLVGGFLSAWWAGRLHVTTESGPSIGTRSRVIAAFGGGAVMGLGAVLARGCTSGQALTGGALLSAGSWTFMLSTFASAFAVAPFARKLWR
jgi:uncharacterized membrane protein YedE/YeeE